MLGLHFCIIFLNVNDYVLQFMKNIETELAIINFAVSCSIRNWTDDSESLKKIYHQSYDCTIKRLAGKLVTLVLKPLVLL